MQRVQGLAAAGPVRGRESGGAEPDRVPPCLVRVEMPVDVDGDEAEVRVLRADGPHREQRREHPAAAAKIRRSSARIRATRPRPLGSSPRSATPSRARPPLRSPSVPRGMLISPDAPIMSSYRLTWRPLRGGHLAIGHKPGKALRVALMSGGCTHTLSLLSDHEDSKEASDTRLRLPLASAAPPAAERLPEIRACLDRVIALLDGGARLYLHCSAGLHRTGMITHALLRYLGHPRAEALAILAELREATAEAATEERLAWGDQFAGLRRD